ncbi:response regulator, partial [Candidatus Woesearchaeota archaeon]|nr:response regulator [Candidatus Woesearchaeota archaeon]
MSKSKILIIEDDFSLAENLKILLEEEGFFVEIATDGQKGVNTVLKYIPDLIICDILMPKYDGYYVKNTLNKFDSTFNIPFIFLTAKSGNENLRKGMNLGADDYIYKPYDTNELLNLINLRIEKKKREITKVIKDHYPDNNEDSLMIKDGNNIQ